MKRKVFTTALTAGVIVSMLGAVPAMAAKKSTVVLPTKYSFSYYDKEKKTWVNGNHSTVSYNKKGLITSMNRTNRFWTSDANGKTKLQTNKYQRKYGYKKGYLSSLTNYTNGKKTDDGKTTYKWSNKGKKETITYTWTNTETNADGKKVKVTNTTKTINTYNKSGKLLTSKDYDADKKLSDQTVNKYNKKGYLTQHTRTYYWTDNDGKRKSETNKNVYKYNKKNQLTSSKSYEDGKLSDTNTYTYKKGYLSKSTYTYYYTDTNESGKQVSRKRTSVTTYKKKGKKITATAKDSDGKKTGVTVYDTRYKMYNPVPEVSPWMTTLPYRIVKQEGYSAETGKLSYSSTTTYKVYKKGAKKGLVSSFNTTSTYYDYETGKVNDTSKYKGSYSYKTVKMTKANKYLQNNYFPYDILEAAGIG